MIFLYMWSEEITNVILNLSELKSFANFIKEKYWHINYSIFFFYGKMGMGKTQLIKYLIEDNILQNVSVTSPTFNILNIYKGIQGEEYLHFDLYRKELINMDQLYSLGLNVLYENKYNKCFIEWPEKINSIELNNLCGIKIKFSEENSNSMGNIEKNIRYINIEVKE